MEKIDYKKKEKDLYLPKTTPSIINVGEMTYIMVDGKGDPNTSESYKEALEILYGLTFTIKMSKMNKCEPVGYFEYVVPPLEGFWWIDDDVFDAKYIINKDKFSWTAVIRQPEFVTEEVFLWAKEKLSRKKPNLDLSRARLEVLEEGQCVQIMHVGSYDSERTSIDKMEEYIIKQGYENDFSTLPNGKTRRHHEIYISDPRKTPSEKLKTVIRHPIKRK